MKILVTGGAGFIGSHLIERLLIQGFSVAAIDNMDDYYDPAIKESNIENFLKDINFYKCDISDKGKIKQIIKKEKVSKIIHLAARPGVRPSLKNPVLYNNINTIGTINVLGAAKDSEVEQFIFGSTSSVYGTNKIPFNEADPVENQLSPYAVSKKAAEMYCKFYSNNYKLPVTCLRFFTVYGPRQRPEMAIHKFTRLMYGQKSMPMFGDGSTSRDYTYISDIIDGVINALFNPFEFEIINLGNSAPVSLSKLISLLEQSTGKKALIDQLKEQPGDMKRTYADISKAAKLLNYKPKVSLKGGLSKFVKWFEQHMLPEIALKN